MWAHNPRMVEGTPLHKLCINTLLMSILDSLVIDSYGCASFMRIIIDIFQLHLGKFVFFYLDDILVFSKIGSNKFQYVSTILGLFC